jgi:hypothetical protein
MLETLALLSSAAALDCCSLGQPTITKTNKFLHQLCKNFLFFILFFFKK